MGSVLFVHGPALDPAGEVDFCEPNLNLLAHAQAIELEVGSRCGGHGRCGGDRVRILEARRISPPTEAERKHLTAAEIESGIRLACQCFPDASEETIRLEIGV
jgi:ferredoxin